MIRSLLISVLLLCAITPFVFAREAQPTGDDPAVEQRLMKLSKELRCLVCQNETLADSPEELNNDPYAAWIFKLQPSDKAELDKLLDAAAYKAAIGE